MIVVDIETIPSPSLPYPTKADIKKNLVKPELIAAELEKIHGKRAVDPAECHIVCITASRWVLRDGNIDWLGVAAEDRIRQWYSRVNDHDLLSAFAAWYWEDPDHTLVGHNALDFDFRAIAWAAMRHGMYDLARAFTSSSKWGDKMHRDTMHCLPGWNSLAKMCRSLGIPHQSVDGGPQVYGWWRDGDDVKICSHGMDDLVAQNILSSKLQRSGLLRVER